MRAFPWWMVPLAAPFSGFHFARQPRSRPYWRHPVLLDNARLVELIELPRPDPPGQALRTSLIDMGCFDRPAHAAPPFSRLRTDTRAGPTFPGSHPIRVLSIEKQHEPSSTCHLGTLLWFTSSARCAGLGCTSRSSSPPALACIFDAQLIALHMPLGFGSVRCRLLGAARRVRLIGAQAARLRWWAGRGFPALTRPGRPCGGWHPLPYCRATFRQRGPAAGCQPLLLFKVSARRASAAVCCSMTTLRGGVRASRCPAARPAPFDIGQHNPRAGPQHPRSSAASAHACPANHVPPVPGRSLRADGLWII